MEHFPRQVIVKFGNKTSLNKFKDIKNISSIFSNHKDKKVEINYKNKIQKKLEIKQCSPEEPMGQRGEKKSKIS